MTCNHCADSVSRALGAGAGVAKVDVDLKSGRAVISGDGLDEAALMATVSGLGYEVKKA